jgi:hypothetical protein
MYYRHHCSEYALCKYKVVDGISAAAMPRDASTETEWNLKETTKKERDSEEASCGMDGTHHSLWRKYRKWSLSLSLSFCKDTNVFQTFLAFNH